MHEKVLLNKKNGMAVMLLSVLFYAAAIVGFVFGCICLLYTSAYWRCCRFW